MCDASDDAVRPLGSTPIPGENRYRGVTQALQCLPGAAPCRYELTAPSLHHSGDQMLLSGQRLLAGNVFERLDRHDWSWEQPLDHRSVRWSRGWVRKGTISYRRVRPAGWRSAREETSCCRFRRTDGRHRGRHRDTDRSVDLATGRPAAGRQQVAEQRLRAGGGQGVVLDGHVDLLLRTTLLGGRR